MEEIEEMNATEATPRYGIVPVGEYGAAHDRGLCALTATVAAVGVSRWLVEHGASALSVYAMGMYFGAAVAGYGIGKWVPAEQRAVTQIACTTVLTLVGVGAAGGL